MTDVPVEVGWREIVLSNGDVALVDAADYDRVMNAAGTWYATPNRHTIYAGRKVRRPDGRQTTQLLHRFLTGDAWRQVDHINGDGLDNRRSNLRLATHAQNMRNRREQTNNSSGFRGVSRHNRRWRASISVGNKDRHLGYYDDPIEAARAYDAAALELSGEFARLNFPLGDMANGGSE